MIRVTNLRGGMGETISILCTGIVLGAAIAAGRAGVASPPPMNPPVLPAARIDYTIATGPRQVVLSGTVKEVDQRANALMMEGWKIVPLTTVLNDGSIAMMTLEKKPRTLK